MLDNLFDAQIGTPESDEADLLCLMIDDYEREHYPTEATDPIEGIKIKMRAKQINYVLFS